MPLHAVVPCFVVLKSNVIIAFFDPAIEDRSNFKVVPNNEAILPFRIIINALRNTQIGM